MKHLTSILLFAGAIGLILGLSNCKTSSIPIQVLVPADITVPTHIQKVAVINRSLPASGSKTSNIVEGFFSGESIFADRDGSENCINGLVNQLNSGPRFTASTFSNIELKGTGTREFPAPLSWREVENLCDINGADALIVLETFDSDINIRKYSQQRKEKVENVEKTFTDYYAELNINVNAGWRIYDKSSQTIVDEKSFMDNKVFKGKGDTPDKALSNLPEKRRAINQAGAYAGQRFGIRISPTWITESRMYYVKKGDDFKQAKRYVQHNEWDEAILIWKLLAENPDPKIAGRACFNLGVANEMKGEYETGLVWMKKAYYDYNIKPANNYINILQRRIQQRQKLDEQLRK